MTKFKCSWSDLLFVIILLVPYNVNASLKITKIPKNGYCVDEQCQKPIAMAAASVMFKSIDPYTLSARERDNITIFSKSDDKNLFPLVEIKGVRGFFPSHLFRINKVYKRSEEVNVPVQFIIDDKTKTIVVKALSNETGTSSEASSVTSSVNSNVSTTSFKESLTKPDIPLKNQNNKGFFFAHASAVEASESPSSGFAPGHNPEFPSTADEVVLESKALPSSSVGTTGGLPTGGGSSIESANPEAQVGESNASQKTIELSEEQRPETDQKVHDESSTENTKSTSGEVEDDEDLEVDSEFSDEYTPPQIHTLQSSINDKTEVVDIVTSTQPVHPSTQSEGSAESETPERTPPVASSGIPPFSSSIPPHPLNIQSSKPVIPDISPSDATTLAPAVDQKQETTTSEAPKNEEKIHTTQPTSENLQIPQTSLNVTEANVDTNQTASSQAESDSLKQYNIASTPSVDRGSTVVPDTFNQIDEISTAEKVDSSKAEWTAVNATISDGSPINASVSDASPVNPTVSSGSPLSANSTDDSSVNATVSDGSPVNASVSDASPVDATVSGGSPVSANSIDGSSVNATVSGDISVNASATEPQASSLGGDLRQEAADLTKETTTEEAALPTSEEAKPAENVEQIQESTPLSDTASYNEIVQVESPTPPKVVPPTQQDVKPIQTFDNYEILHPAAGYFQPQAQPVKPVSQPSANEPYGVPTPTDPAPAAQPPYPHGQLQGQPLAGQLPTAQPPIDQNILLQPRDNLPPPLPSIALPTGSSVLYDTLSQNHYTESGVPSAGEPSVDRRITAEGYETTTVEPVISEDAHKAPEQPEILQEEAESSTSWWDMLFSFLSPAGSSGDSHVDIHPPKLPDQPDQYSPNSRYPSQQDVPHSPVVTTCPDGSLGPDCPQESFLPFKVDDLFSGLGVDSLMTRFIAAAFTLLLCIIAYFFVENRRMDGRLVARVNALERELMVLSKENTLLKEECASNIGEGQLEVFLKELEEAKAARADLEEQVATLERDLDEAAEANMELNQMLAETLESPKGVTDDVLASFQRFQAQLDGQRDTIGNMTRSLSSKNAEIEGLKAQITECRETISGLEAEVTTLNETIANLRREKEDANIAHVEKLQEVQNQLAEAVANKVLEESRLGSELSSVKLNLKKTRQIVVAKESEVEALKESFRELKSKGVSEEKLTKLFDAVKLHAQVEQLTQERNELEESLRGEGDARKRLEDHVRVIEEEVNKLRVNYEEAQKEKTEAQTRLEVLSNYFKEKEAQLKKEVELHEVLLAQQRGDENSVLRQVQSLQGEVETYRSQNESLKREIIDQERELKNQIATIEKKSHDNWVAARQAERKLEECRQEASQLRNRLTLVEKNLSSSGVAGGVEANGEGGVASPVMGLPGMGPVEITGPMGSIGSMILPPPPPIDLDSSSGLPPFMFPPMSPGSLPPPPFLPPMMPPSLLVGDRRPAPLGRMSSPPLPPPPPPGHFTPPPSHFDRLDRPSQPPSPTYHRSPAGGERQGFRPFAKPSPRKPTDYRGSNLSSDQSDKSEKTRAHERV